MKILIDTKRIIKKYKVSYYRINYLTKKGYIKVVKKTGNKRWYDPEEIDNKFGVRIY